MYLPQESESCGFWIRSHESWVPMWVSSCDRCHYLMCYLMLIKIFCLLIICSTWKDSSPWLKVAIQVYTCCTIMVCTKPELALLLWWSFCVIKFGSACLSLWAIWVKLLNQAPLKPGQKPISFSQSQYHSAKHSYYDCCANLLENHAWPHLFSFQYPLKWWMQQGYNTFHR